MWVGNSGWSSPAPRGITMRPKWNGFGLRGGAAKFAKSRSDTGGASSVYQRHWLRNRRQPQQHRGGLVDASARRDVVVFDGLKVTITAGTAPTPPSHRQSTPTGLRIATCVVQPREYAEVIERSLTAGGGNRTHTSTEGLRILNPARLPVPPLRPECFMPPRRPLSRRRLSSTGVEPVTFSSGG